MIELDPGLELISSNVQEPEPKINKFKGISIYILTIMLIGSLFFTIFNFQVVQGAEKYKESYIVKSSSRIIRAQRGRIYDRNGVLLAFNEPAYRIYFDNSKVDIKQEEKIIKQLAEVLGKDPEQLFSYYKTRTTSKNGERILLEDLTMVGSISRDEVLALYSNLEKLTGVGVEVNFIRRYPYGVITSHILGYVGEITAKDKENDKSFDNGDIIGKSGIEFYYDKLLRGKNGRRYYNSSNLIESVVESPTLGNDLYLTIDINIQTKLYDSLKAGILRNNLKAGASVIQDVNDGSIIALVSYPSYDSNFFSTKVTQEEYDKLLQDPDYPLLNRVISQSEPPGSTFKTLVSIAALEEKAISTKTRFDSPGCIDLDSKTKFCEANKKVLGTLDYYNAIARSSNIYFCKTMLSLGIDKLNIYTHRLHLPGRTGIDIPGEVTGSIASRDYKLQVERTGWYDGDSCNTAIGQGLTRVTPLQMSYWVSVIANGGDMYMPHLGLRAERPDEEKVVWSYEKNNLGNLNVSKSTLEAIRTAMRLAVTNPGSTGWSLRGLKSSPAVKTGSAEIGGGNQAHSWTIGYWPYKNPQYSFSMFLQNGSWGFYSVDVVKDFLMSFN